MGEPSRARTVSSNTRTLHGAVPLAIIPGMQHDRARPCSLPLAIGAVLVILSGAGCGYASFGASYRGDLDTTLHEDGSLGRWGADIGLAERTCRGVLPVEARYFIYYDRHGELPQGLYAAVDLAPALYARSRPISERRLFVALKPLAGVWHWVESPHNAGILTGVKAGIGRTVARDASTLEFLLEYGVLWLNDTLDDGDTEMRVVNLTVTRRW